MRNCYAIVMLLASPLALSQTNLPLEKYCKTRTAGGANSYYQCQSFVSDIDFDNPVYVNDIKVSDTKSPFIRGMRVKHQAAVSFNCNSTAPIHAFLFNEIERMAVTQNPKQPELIEFYSSFRDHDQYAATHHYVEMEFAPYTTISGKCSITVGKTMKYIDDVASIRLFASQMLDHLAVSANALSYIDDLMQSRQWDQTKLQLATSTVKTLITQTKAECRTHQSQLQQYLANPVDGVSPENALAASLEEAIAPIFTLNAINHPDFCIFTGQPWVALLSDPAAMTSKNIFVSLFKKYLDLESLLQTLDGSTNIDSSALVSAFEPFRDKMKNAMTANIRELNDIEFFARGEARRLGVSASAELASLAAYIKNTLDKAGYSK